MGTPQKELENGGQELFEEKMAVNFFEMIKKINPEIQEMQSIHKNWVN